MIVIREGLRVPRHQMKLPMDAVEDAVALVAVARSVAAGTPIGKEKVLPVAPMIAMVMIVVVGTAMAVPFDSINPERDTACRYRAFEGKGVTVPVDG
jgi:hypothetical protein